MAEVEGLADGEPPSQSPTPPICIRLYDDQELTGRRHHRWQSSTGAWMYHVTVTLWAVTRLGARDVSEPADVEFDAPSSHVEPIPGISYAGVPLTRHRDAIIRARTGRRLPTPQAPVSGQRPLRHHRVDGRTNHDRAGCCRDRSCGPGRGSGGGFAVGTVRRDRAAPRRPSPERLGV